MKLVARYDSVGYRVPGGETLWLEVDGQTVGVHSRPAYRHSDGTLEPGLLRSPVATEIRFVRYPGETLHVRPVVCEVCGDSGDSQKCSWYPCEACHGYGHEKNIHVCVTCDGSFRGILRSIDQTEAHLYHQLLAPRECAACAACNTLEEWLAASPVDVVVHPSGACSVPDSASIQPKHRARLWRLTDFLVSSVSGGSIWLIKRAARLERR